eukprot:TRINITY_DN28008_c0_g1_i1.p1 TRINITY_DN28008_c0_g1~~TRINITY_DN28008_c0_g1_i1.p1  ORF type:complete len:769 (-),score=117.09 TRINITY_DN28008_c0_g1_i1:2-2308(-)
MAAAGQQLPGMSSSGTELLGRLRGRGLDFDSGSLQALARLAEADQLRVLRKFASYTVPIRNASALLMYFLRQEQKPEKSQVVSELQSLPTPSRPMGQPGYTPARVAGDTHEEHREGSVEMSSPSSSQALAEVLLPAASQASQDIRSVDTTIVSRKPSAVKHALSLDSPALAFLSVTGVRMIESRPWRLPAGWYALHVSSSISSVPLPSQIRVPIPDSLPTACIPAIMRLGPSVPADSFQDDPWAVGPWCQAIEEVVVLQSCIPAVVESSRLWVLPSHLRETVQSNLPAQDPRMASSCAPSQTSQDEAQRHSQLRLSPGLQPSSEQLPYEQSLRTQTEGLEIAAQPQSHDVQDETLLPASCAVCYCDFSEAAPRCDHSCDEHMGMLCRDCMQAHIAARGPLPKCPLPGCTEELSEHDVSNFGDAHSVERWQSAALQRALQALPGIKVSCPQEECSMVVEVDLDGARSRIICPACNTEFCSRCRQMYHFRVECEEVQTLRQRYTSWLCEGRAKYEGEMTATDRALSEREASLQAAQKRFNELVKDEEFKAKSCRHCPHCSRIVQKLEGCNAMRCGFDTDTRGNVQDGCGKSFDWTTAPPYRAQVGPAPQAAPLAEDFALLQARSSVPHHQWRCDLCDEQICGLRFRCVHCPAFDCCVRCEKTLGETHPEDHVFEILTPCQDQIEAHITSMAKASRGTAREVGAATSSGSRSHAAASNNAGRINANSSSYLRRSRSPVRRRRKAGSCLRCGSRGHWAASCPRASRAGWNSE